MSLGGRSIGSSVGTSISTTTKKYGPHSKTEALQDLNPFQQPGRWSKKAGLFGHPGNHHGHGGPDDMEKGTAAGQGPGPAELSPENKPFDLGSVYQARQYNNPEDQLQNNALNRRFDVLRGKAEGAANENSQVQNDALQRALAAHGRLGSGSGIKQSQLLNKSLDQAKTNAIGDVESQREVGAADLAQQQAARKFQFENEEANKAFQSQENYSQRGFAAQQAQRDNDFRTAQFNEQNRQFGQQMDMAAKQMDLDKSITDFNERMAKRQARGGHRDIVQRGGDWFKKTF